MKIKFVLCLFMIFSSSSTTDIVKSDFEQNNKNRSNTEISSTEKVIKTNTNNTLTSNPEIIVSKKNSTITLRRGITPTDNKSQLENGTILKPNESIDLILVKENKTMGVSNQTITLNNSSLTLNSTKKLNFSNTTISLHLNSTTASDQPKTNVSSIIIKPTQASVDQAKTDIQKVTSVLSSNTSTTKVFTIINTTIIITTTTIPPKPKKPMITYGTEDFPDIDKNIPKSSSSPIENLEIPNVEASSEILNKNPGFSYYTRQNSYFIPIVALICFIPVLMVTSIVIYRRFREFWSTRHYRRMDFLVDGMYND